MTCYGGLLATRCILRKEVNIIKNTRSLKITLLVFEIHSLSCQFIDVCYLKNQCLVTYINIPRAMIEHQHDRFLLILRTERKYKMSDRVWCVNMLQENVKKYNQIY